MSPYQVSNQFSTFGFTPLLSFNCFQQVVFVRGLPADCLESELLALCCPFAVVEKSLLIPQKCQAFVQLPDVASASNLITFYQTRDAMIRGKKIFFEYSSRDEITVRSSYDQAQAGASRAPPSQQQYHQQQSNTQQHHAPPPSQQQQQHHHESRGGPPTSSYHMESAGTMQTFALVFGAERI